MGKLNGTNNRCLAGEMLKMTLTKEDLTIHYQKYINYLIGEIERHKALDTSNFPYEQMQVYKSNFEKFEKNLEIAEATVEALKEGD